MPPFPLLGGSVLAVAGLFGQAGWLAAFAIIAALQWPCVLIFLARLWGAVAPGSYG